MGTKAIPEVDFFARKVKPSKHRPKLTHYRIVSFLLSSLHVETVLLLQNEQRILRLEVQTQRMTLRAREAFEFCPLNRPPLSSAPRPKSARDCVQQSRDTARQKVYLVFYNSNKSLQLRDHFRDTKHRPQSAFARIETKETTTKSTNDSPVNAVGDVQSLTLAKLQQEVENRKRSEEVCKHI